MYLKNTFILKKMNIKFNYARLLNNLNKVKIINLNQHKKDDK